MSSAELAPQPSASAEELRPDLTQALIAARLPGRALDERALLTLRLLIPLGPKLVPSLAALYLLGDDPTLTLPSLSVRAARFAGPGLDAPIVAEDELRGPLPELARASLAWVRDHSRELVNQLDPSDARPEYPEAAVAAWIANALLHRDLRAPGPVALRLFPDRLEIWSPGSSALPRALNDYQRSGGIALPRNPLLSTLARALGVGTGLGRGLALAHALCIEHATRPILEESKEGVLVRANSPYARGPRLLPE